MPQSKKKPQDKAWDTIRKNKKPDDIHADYLKRGRKAHGIKNEAVRPLLIKWRGESTHQIEHCIVCGETMRNTFDVHHLDGNERNNRSDNKVTLCASCHRIVNRTKSPEEAVLDFKQRHERKEKACAADSLARATDNEIGSV